MFYYSNFNCSSRNFSGLCAGDSDHHSVVIVLHGLTACKETQKAELERLACSGFYAVALDAPHHGDRKTGLVDLSEGMQYYDRHHLMMACVLQHAAEVSALIELFRKMKKKIAVIGISMGGYTAFALTQMKHRPDFIASFLGSPDFRSIQLEKQFPPSLLELAGPADSIDTLFPLPFFMVSAGQDQIVPPTFSRNFYEALRSYFKQNPDLLEYHEYPESQHMMRPQDWHDAWNKFENRLVAEGF